MKTKMEEMSVEDVLALPKRDFIKRCLEWNKVFNDGKLMKVSDPMDCPVAIWVVHNDAKCNKEMVPNTAKCPVCGSQVCPDCMNHNVDIISRVTGYLSTVSGWNAAKKQEFEDRQRYEPEKQGRR